MKTRKFTALLLVLCLLLTATPYSAPVHAVEEEHLAQEQTQTQEETRTATETAETTTAPLAEGVFFQFVDQAVFQANGHVARVPEEETLSTYVFRNSDGTKTVYYLPDNVKYIAEDGTMVDKDLTLVSETGGYGVARSDIQYLLPTSVASGIRMTHGNKQVTMYPQAPLGRATAATVSGDSVRYDNYFGSGIHLVYTPIPSGLKEDIVLDSYTGVNSFTFTLQTNGMRLYNDEGQYYFAASADAEERMYLGDIIVYDAKGEPSAGTLTVTPVTMGQQYTLTVSADPAFLTDPDTVYPVTIDPTLSIRAATDSAFIEDATICENNPSVNYGSWPSNHCGSFDSYGRCRTVVRLAGLKTSSIWQSMTCSDIISAKFYTKESSGTNAVRITLHRMTNTTWTESNATWNTLANAFSVTVSGYSSPAGGQWAEFNFTGLAREWKSNNASSDCSFMLINTNYTLDKAFYSAEYGTTSYRPYVVITYNEDTIETDGLNYTSHVMDEGSSLRLSWPDVTSEVTWTSSNDSIARVDGTGFVRGIRTGMATITASADGYAPQTCTITITIRDGIYYLRNNRSNYFLGVPNSKVSSGTTLRQEAKSTSEPTCFAQMWRITHLSGQHYIIRPVHKPNMALSASSTQLSIQDIEAMPSIPNSCKWQITYDQNGYVFTRGSYDMLPTGHSTALNATVAMGTSNVSGSHLWSFILTDSFDDQMLLYDKRTSSYCDSATLDIGIGETQTLSQLDIDIAYISEDTIEQDITWTSNNTSVATVGNNRLTGMHAGTATITASVDNQISKSFTVHVVLENGVYYIDASPGISLGTGGAQSSQSRVKTYTKALSGTNKHHQLWEIKYISDGKYSIHAFENENLLLYKNGTQVVIYQTSSTASIPTDAKWTIEYTANGYKILNNGSPSYAMTVSGSDTSPGQFVTTSSYASSSAQAHWNLESVDEYTCIVNHYYDEGYSIRFAEINSNTESLIRSYHDVVYKRLLDIFSIYIVSEYNSFTSSCDTCKLQQYGSIQFVSLDDACTHTTSHLTQTALRDDLEDGTATQVIVIWTGHILDGNSRSSSHLTRHSIVITPYGTTLYDENSQTYVNKSEYQIEYQSIYSLIHELSHQFDAKDHYCYEKGENPVCSNPYCDECQYGYPEVRDCIMGKRCDISTKSDEELYCDTCLTIIGDHLEDHH